MAPETIIKFLLSPDMLKQELLSILLIVFVVSMLYNNYYLQNKLVKVIENNTKAVAKVEAALNDCKLYRKEMEKSIYETEKPY